MEHYNIAQWQTYREGLINKKERQAMEEHLYQCDLCLESYIQTIELPQLEQAKSLLPKDFGSRTQKAINTTEKAAKKAKTTGSLRLSENTRLLLYYTAAASIAILFTFNGLFDTFASKIPANIGGLPLLETKLENRAPGEWSSDLMERTIGWIDALIDDKEVIKK